jgi:hypothetical protein
MVAAFMQFLRHGRGIHAVNFLSAALANNRLRKSTDNLLRSASDVALATCYPGDLNLSRIFMNSALGFVPRFVPSRLITQGWQQNQR